MTCIASVLHRRIQGGPFPASKFHLGVWGYFVNAYAIAFLALAFVFLFFPSVPNPTPASMNWGILIYGVAVLFALGYYLVKGRHEYQGPVHYVRWQTQHDVAD
jgi:choline transport protein